MSKPEVNVIGWNDLSDGLTSVLIVPGGMIVEKTGMQESENGIALASSMAFVPCIHSDGKEWVETMLQVPKT